MLNETKTEETIGFFPIFIIDCILIGVWAARTPDVAIVDTWLEYNL